MAEHDSLKTRIAAIPRKTWILSGGAVLLLASIALLVIVILPDLMYPPVTLNSQNPTYIHPDGLALSLVQSDQSAQVRVESLPREAFIGNQIPAKWKAARAALPSVLTPLSPLYTFHISSRASVSAQMSIPNDAEPLTRFDLYRWDSTSRQWVFLPSTKLPDGINVGFQPVSRDMTVMAFHAEAQTPAAALIVSQGGPDLAAIYGTALPEGLTIDEAGQIDGTPVSTTASNVLPTVANRNGGFAQYDDPGQAVIIREQLVSRLLIYNGLVLDFDPGPGFADFVVGMAEHVHAHNKRLEIIIRGNPNDYDLEIIAPVVDRLWYAPGDDPNLYVANGTVANTLSTLVGTVERRKLGLLVSALNVDLLNGATEPITTSEGLSHFGDVQINGVFDPNTLVGPGSALPFRLSGQVTSMGFDEPLNENYLTYYDDAGQLHYVYFSSAQGLAHRLSWVRVYGLGSVAVYGIAHPDSPQGVSDGLGAFLSQQALNNPSAMQIVWRVESASGASLSEQQGDLSLIQYLWQAVTDPGSYTVSAAINDGKAEDSRGKVVINVGNAPTVVVPTPTATSKPRVSTTPNPNETPVPQQPTPAPVSGQIAAGQFEYGGQTQTFSHPDLMHGAGMSWVKFQHKWNPGDGPAGAVGGKIGDAHGKGFKILLSIPGPSSPSSIDYAAYVNFVAGVAALNPDAIEIWNEMNFNFEWPADQIGGDVYVNNMLAPAYQAIKAANPSVMVISGAPTPTGAFNGCGSIGDIKGCDDWYFIKQMHDAGAASYLDCVGVHYNEGIISPAQTTGDPRPFGDFYSRYFFGMLNLYYGTFGKPLCFTELGYLTPQGYGALPQNFAWAAGTTVDQQAQWLSQAAVLASQSNKVRLMIIFNVDFTAYGADPQAGYAMVRPDGSCPACDALSSVKH